MRRYLIFGMAAIAMLLSAIDSTAVSVAFPIIIPSFDISLVVAGWVLTAYQLALIAVLPVSGKITDVLGRKRTFLAFLALFLAGSVLCSFAWNAPSLIIFRIIQGIGGSGFTPSATGMVAEEFPHMRQRAIGLLSSILPIGWIIGPNLGAWLVDSLGWRSIFWINIPLCIVAFVVSFFLMRPGKKQTAYIDFVGSGMLAVALLLLIAGLSEIGNVQGTPWMLVSVLLASSLIILVVFWRRNVRLKEPIIEPEIIKKKPFMAANAFNLAYGGVIGAVTLVPLYAVTLYGMSTIESGYILTPRSIAMMVFSAVTAFFLVKLGYRLPLLIGSLGLIPPFLVLAMEPVAVNILGFRVSDIVLMATTLGVVGTVVGISSPAANNACIELMPDRIGTITAMRVMFRQTGAILSITAGSIIMDLNGIAPGFRLYFLCLIGIIILVMVPSALLMTGRSRNKRG